MSGQSLIQRRVFVSGRVQGVGFRAFVHKKALRFPNVCGFVRNLHDGRVEAVFVGEESEVLSLAASCKQGPVMSKVVQLEVKEESVDAGLGRFEIKQDV